MKKSNIILLSILAVIIIWLTGMAIVLRLYADKPIERHKEETTVKLKPANVLQLQGNGYIRIEQAGGEEQISGNLKENTIKYSGDTLIVENSKNNRKLTLRVNKINNIITKNNISAYAINVKSSDTLILHTHSNSQFTVDTVHCSHLELIVEDNSNLYLKNRGLKRCKSINYNITDNASAKLYGFKDIELKGKLSGNGKFKID